MSKIVVDLNSDKEFNRMCDRFVTKFKGSQLSKIDVNQRQNSLHDLNSEFGLLQSHITSVQASYMKSHNVDETGIVTKYPTKFRKCKKIYNRGNL
jgi:hypothetical protein